MNDIRNLEPKALWNHFADLNEVPRPSKKEERVIEFMKAFGEKLGLPTMVDEVGNVIIKKGQAPAWKAVRPWYYRATWIWSIRKTAKRISTSTKKASKC